MGLGKTMAGDFFERRTCRCWKSGWDMGIEIRTPAVRVTGAESQRIRTPEGFQRKTSWNHQPGAWLAVDLKIASGHGNPRGK